MKNVSLPVKPGQNLSTIQTVLTVVAGGKKFQISNFATGEGVVTFDLEALPNSRTSEKTVETALKSALAGVPVTNTPPIGGQNLPVATVTTVVTVKKTNADGSVEETVTTTEGTTTATNPCNPCAPGCTPISDAFLTAVATATGYSLDWVRMRRCQWGFSTIEQLAGPCLVLPYPATASESALVQRVAQQFLGLTPCGC